MRIVDFLKRQSKANKDVRQAEEYDALNDDIRHLLELQEQLDILELETLAEYAKINKQIDAEGSSNAERFDALQRFANALQQNISESIKRTVTEQIRDLSKVGTMQSLEMAEEVLGIHQRSGTTFQELSDTVKRNSKWLLDYHRLDTQVDAALNFLNKKADKNDLEMEINRKMIDLKAALHIRSLSDCELLFEDLKNEISKLYESKQVLIGALMKKYL